MNSEQKTNLVTKSDLNKVFARWTLGAQMSGNYETMQAGGVVATLAPLLRKIYPDDEEFKQAVLSHFVLFNTNTWIGNIIVGAVIAIEESHEIGGFKETREAVAAIKTGLMGPLAGVGDAVLVLLPMTIFGVMAGNMALEGGAFGIVLGVGYWCVSVVLRHWFLFMGYKQGNKFVTTLSARLKNITHAATILGLMVIGALIASSIKINIPIVFTQSGVSVALQDTLNMIMPNLMPALLTFLIYWSLGKRDLRARGRFS